MKLQFKVIEDITEDAGTINIALLAIADSGFLLESGKTSGFTSFQFIYEIGEKVNPILLLTKESGQLLVVIRQTGLG